MLQGVEKVPSNSSQLYDPRISALVAQAADDWGEPKQARGEIIQYGLNYVDQALWGIQFSTGELLGIKGAKKNRKTTLMANIVLNVAMQLEKKGNPFWIAIDTLESGLGPSAYRDMLWAILATWELVADVFGRNREEWPRGSALRAHPILGQEMRISKRWLRFADRSERQHKAILKAATTLSSLPLMIFGPSSRHGEASDIRKTIRRWDLLYNGAYPAALGYLVRMFCTDNIQEYAEEGSDYKVMKIIVGALAGFISSHEGSVGFAVSQIGTGSVKDERQGLGQAHARGGWRFAEECNIVFRTKYDQEKSPYYVTIQIDDSRDANIPRLIQEIDNVSGAFLRPAVTAKDYLNE